jgi:hypothetical protein
VKYLSSKLFANHPFSQFAVDKIVIGRRIASP